MTHSAQAEHPHLELLRAYLTAIEQDADEERIASFFAPDVVQQEFPNRFVEQGSTRGLSQLLEGRRRGRQVVQNQRYTIKNALVDGDRVALELFWTAELRLPVGSLAAGASMSANCGVFFRIADGRIIEQHNFDCFDPF